MSNFLGLDLGTSSLKALVVDDQGTVLATARSAYQTVSGGPGEAEQDPESWTAACRSVCARLDLSAIDAVGIVGHTPTLVPTDAERRPTRNALIWQDSRAVGEAAMLSGLGQPEDVVGGVLPWSPAYLPAKLGWLAVHDRPALEAARWLMQPKDHLGFAATGVAATDVWSSKGLCRIDNGQVVTPVFTAFGVDERLLPERRDPWALLGRVDGPGHLLTGLPVDMPVAVGWTDALGGMVALGVFGRPTAFVHTGTSDIVGTSHHGDRPAPAGGTDTVLNIPATCAPLPVAYGPTQTAGAALDWLTALLGRPLVELLAVAESASSHEIPLILPFFDGERAPLWRPDLRGQMRGLSLATGPAELVRGVLRGVALADRHVLTAAGSDEGEVHVGGASAVHPAWVRARLECWGRPLVLHENADVAAVGAAMLAASAARPGTALGEIADQMAGPVTLMTPGPYDRAAADDLFRAYRSAVDQLL